LFVNQERRGYWIWGVIYNLPQRKSKKSFLVLHVNMMIMLSIELLFNKNMMMIMMMIKKITCENKGKMQQRLLMMIMVSVCSFE